MDDNRQPGFTALLARSGQEPWEFWEQIADGGEALLVVNRSRQVVWANAAGRRLMEVDLDEAANRTCIDVIACPNCECRCRLFEDGGVEGMEVVIYPRGESKPRTYRKNARLLRNAEGKVIGGVESLVDVTTETNERLETARRAELVLRERKRADALIDSFSEGVFTLGVDGRVREFSRGLVELTGFAQPEAEGRHFAELLGIPALPDLATTSTAPFDVELRTRSGERVAVRISFLPMRYGSDEVLAIVRRQSQPEDEAASLMQRHGFLGILTRSESMQALFELVRNAASSDASVLVQGESGTGKELVARALHQLSPRAQQPYFAVNCATFTNSLLLSELFGHERGAFTGAVARQRGKLELAGRGTLLLDEITEIPLEYQAVLLRVLEHRRFERVGGHAPLELQARVIAATNRPLQDAVARGDFRSDLFYRLNVVPLHIPPLRERPDDIELLAEYFLLTAGCCCSGRRRELTPSARAALTAYPWPGNVREVKNLMEYLCLGNHPEISVEHLPAYITGRDVRSTPVPSVAPPKSERDRILEALAQANYRRTKAARLLGMDRSTLWRKLKKHGIAVE